MEGFRWVPSEERQDVPLEQCPVDVADEQVIDQFFRDGCGCRKWGGKPCIQQFGTTQIRQARLYLKDLEKSELDMVIMAHQNISSSVVTESRHSAASREKPYTVFYHQGKEICQATFRFIHGIGKFRYESLKKSLKKFGMAPRVHGNKRRKPKHALSLCDVEYIVRFLLNYTVEHGLLLPGRVPGYSRTDLKLLPSSTSKRKIWDMYVAAAQNSDVRSVAWTTFLKIWRSQLPQVLLMKPATDLCWQCQQNSASILRSANCPEREKSNAVKSAEKHLLTVQLERSFYRTTCADCRRSVQDCFTTDDSFEPPPLSSRFPANSKDIQVHYSFDYAQQVHFPSDPLQPGPIYFLTPRKCAVFGVHCEAIPRQVNF